MPKLRHLPKRPLPGRRRLRPHPSRYHLLLHTPPHLRQGGCSSFPVVRRVPAPSSKSFMKTARISPWRFTTRTFTPPPNIKSAAMNKSSSAQLGTFRSRNSPTTLKTGFKPPCPIKTSLNAAPAAPSVLSYA